MSTPTTEAKPVGIQARINVDGHEYMLVSEHYACYNAAIDAATAALREDNKRLKAEVKLLSAAIDGCKLC